VSKLFDCERGSDRNPCRWSFLMVGPTATAIYPRFHISASVAMTSYSQKAGLDWTAPYIPPSEDGNKRGERQILEITLGNLAPRKQGVSVGSIV
jgi:hypothetical protein